MFPIDPRNPVPLYHQIAAAVRERIASGELLPGQALEPLREAARHYGVNLHTVRHAYTALAREGLIESRGRAGTRVRRPERAAAGDEPSLRAAREDFLEHVLDTARARFGLGASELSAALVERAARASNKPEVWVVECSAWQCACHARELEQRFGVTAREWSLERAGEPPRGHVVSNWFHYNDIRRRWPQRLGDVHFVTIRPDAGLARALPRPRSQQKLRVQVLERDAETAANIAADVSVILPERHYELEPAVAAKPARFVAAAPRGDVILCAPRVWAQLAEEERTRPGLFEVRYVFDERELDALGAKLGWSFSPTRRESVAVGP